MQYCTTTAFANQPSFVVPFKTGAYAVISDLPRLDIDWNGWMAKLYRAVGLAQDTAAGDQNPLNLTLQAGASSTSLEISENAGELFALQEELEEWQAAGAALFWQLEDDLPD